MTNTVTAVVKCEACGRVSKGQAVELPDSNVTNCDEAAAEEILRRAVQGLMRAYGNDLHCPGCRVPIFSRGAKMRLVYEEQPAIH